MNTLVQFALDRAKERSTWVGLIGMLSTLGVALKPELAEAIASVGVAVSSMILVITEDMKHKAEEKAAEAPKGE